jgi:acyl dehydratase
MGTVEIEGVEGMRSLLGREIGPSEWRQVTQDDIDTFARLSGDDQWIHVDVERAKSESPFGTTIAHGFLTLALCVPMLSEVLPPVEGGGMVVNYGVNRVRFPAAVPAGSRIRGRLRVTSVEEGTAGERANIEAVVECEGVEKPVCVAELVVLTVSLQPEAS